MKRGDIVKMIEQILIAFLYPTNLEKGLARTTAIIVGRIPNMRSFELV